MNTWSCVLCEATLRGTAVTRSTIDLSLCSWCEQSLTQRGLQRCRTCNAPKAFDAFPSDRTKPSGRQSSCTPCRAAKSAVYRAANQERMRAKKAAYNAERRDVINANNRQRYQANAEQIKARRRERYQRNPEPERTRSREWASRNRERNRVRLRVWHQKNRARVQVRSHAYRQRRKWEQWQEIRGGV